MSELYVFDAYGTLFNVHAAAARQRERIGPNYERLSLTWRAKHLEYTWVHAQTGRMTDFWTLAQRSLDYAIATIGGVPAGVREALLASYRRMDAYPEVPAMLERLRARSMRTAILTNGDPDMIAEAVSAAGLDGRFDAVLSVQQAGIFKPARRVYQLVHDHLGGTPGDVTFYSQNRWDVAGASLFGFRTVWVNRAGMPDEYPEMPAAAVVADLTAVR
jgi:2-haloacid dehalogenase